MSKPPYPGYPPNVRSVTATAGLHRTCLVLDCLSLQPLSEAELAVIQESMELAVDKLRSRLASLESIRIIPPDRFDTLLRTGLRI